MVRDDGSEIVKKYPAYVEPGDNFTDRRKDTEYPPCLEYTTGCGSAKKGGRFPNGEHIHGTEPNGKWRLNYRLRRILRVCTAARYKRGSCRVCLSTKIDSRTTDGRR